MKVHKYKGATARYYVTDYIDILTLTKWMTDNNVGWKMLRPLKDCPFDEYGVKITKNRMWFELKWL